MLDRRNRKRIIIFLLIPLLAVIPFLTEDLSIRIISTVLLVIYVGFIIFLRDSKRIEERISEPDLPEDDLGSTPNPYENLETDEGEGFDIISPKKEVEIITADEYNSRVVSRPVTDFKPKDLKENYIKIATEEIPSNFSHDEYFGFVLEKLLNVAKDSFLAHSAMFFWYNAKKNKLTLDRFVSPSDTITRQKFDIENDLLSEIVNKEEPQWIGNISPAAEPDVIRYYSSPQGIRSFIGVPLFYGKHLTGILALDSKDQDAFGPETAWTLGRLVRVISVLISLFEEKYSESISEQRLNALISILSVDKKFIEPDELFDTIENAVRNLIKWDVFTFVYFDPKTKRFLTSRIVNNTTLKYVGEGLEIDLNKSFAGKAINTGIPVYIEDTSDTSKPQIRFTEAEDITFDGSFLALPLVYEDQNFGVLCFENLKKSFYTNSDIKFYKNAIKIFAFIAYSHSNQNALRGLLSVDPETKLLNKDWFFASLEQDLLKQNEVKSPGSLALVHIDEFLEQDSLFEGDPFPKVLKEIKNMILAELPPLATIGRISRRVIAIHFFNKTVQDVFLWAEKIRIKIARKPMSVLAKQNTFTISV
ncbi:MAG: GAF domain-containing protein, partial [Ignavibacteria bacterium]